jgi:hypothetical protein
MFPGKSVGQINAELNEHTHVCLKKFEGVVVPMIITKRKRLLSNASGISFSNFNLTTCKGNVNIHLTFMWCIKLFLMLGIWSSGIDVMKKMVWVVSENSAAGHKKMQDKVIASKVHQYHPLPFSVKTLMILVASTRYLSHIGVLDDLFRHDQAIAARTQSCKLARVVCFDF